MTLVEFLTSVAGAIREKTGKTEKIMAKDFVREIQSISGSNPVLQDLTITKNNDTYTPDLGYDGFGQVTVEIPFLLQEKVVTENGDVFPDEGYDGLSKVTVDVQNSGNVKLAEKRITANGEYIPVTTSIRPGDSVEFKIDSSDIDFEQFRDLPVTSVTGAGDNPTHLVLSDLNGWVIAVMFEDEGFDCNSLLCINTATEEFYVYGIIPSAGEAPLWYQTDPNTGDIELLSDGPVITLPSDENAYFTDLDVLATLFKESYVDIARGLDLYPKSAIDSEVINTSGPVTYFDKTELDIGIVKEIFTITNGDNQVGVGYKAYNPANGNVMHEYVYFFSEPQLEENQTIEFTDTGWYEGESNYVIFDGVYYTNYVKCDTPTEPIKIPAVALDGQISGATGRYSNYWLSKIFTCPEARIRGYDKVTVDIQPKLSSIVITKNGTYLPNVKDVAPKLGGRYQIKEDLSTLDFNQFTKWEATSKGYWILGRDDSEVHYSLGTSADGDVHMFTVGSTYRWTSGALSCFVDGQRAAIPGSGWWTYIGDGVFAPCSGVPCLEIIQDDINPWCSIAAALSLFDEGLPFDNSYAVKDVPDYSILRKANVVSGLNPTFTSEFVNNEGKNIHSHIQLHTTGNLTTHVTMYASEGHPSSGNFVFPYMIYYFYGGPDGAGWYEFDIVSEQATKTVKPEQLFPVPVTGTFTDNFSQSTLLGLFDNSAFDGYGRIDVAVDTFAANLQERGVTPSEEIQEVIPEEGYDGFSKVTVAAIRTEEKTVDTNGDVTPTPGSYLKKVTVQVPNGYGTSDATATEDTILEGYTAYVDGEKLTGKRKFTTQIKEVYPTTSDQTVTPHEDYDGLSAVVVKAIETEEKTVNSNGTVTPTDGKYLSKVIVEVPEGLDTSDATATETTILDGYTAYVNGNKITGTKKFTLQTKSATPTEEEQKITADSEYDGLSEITIAPILTEEVIVKENGDVTASEGKYLKLVSVQVPQGVDPSDATASAEHILAGYTAYVNGGKITGTKTFTLQIKTVTPSDEEQTISADESYDGLSEVLVSAVDAEEVTVRDNGTITAEAGKYFNKIIVEVPKGTDTADATATAETILEGYTAYVNGEKITGTKTFITQTKSAAPGETEQKIIPDADIDGLAEVIISPIVTEEKEVTTNGDVIPTAGKYLTKVVVKVPEGLDSSDATATAAEILDGYTAYINGGKVTGTKKFVTQNKEVDPIEEEQEITPDPGIDGLDKVTVAAIQTEERTVYANGPVIATSGKYLKKVIVQVPNGYGTADATATAEHILEGYTAYVNGSKITGTKKFKIQTKYATPTEGEQIVTPDSDFDYLSQVVIAPIQIEELEPVTTNGQIQATDGKYFKSITVEVPQGVDTSDATATADSILQGHTAYVKGEKITGTKVFTTQHKEATPSEEAQEIIPDLGIDGLSKVTVTPIETEEKTVTENGLVVPSAGKYLTKVVVQVPEKIDTSDATATEDTILDGYTAYVNDQKITGKKKFLLQEKQATQNGTITPDSGFDGLSRVIIKVESSVATVERGIVYDTVDDNGDPTRIIVYGSKLPAYGVYSCETVTEVELKSGVTTIGQKALANCTALSNIILADTIETISSNAFENCSAISAVYIPCNATTIEDNIFAGCSSLESITLEGTPTSISANAFANCPSLRTIIVPWEEGQVPNAPWGAENAEIQYKVRTRVINDGVATYEENESGGTTLTID